MNKRSMIYWAERLDDLRENHDGYSTRLALQLGVIHSVLSSWLRCGKIPLLATAVQVSTRAGYTLDHMIGADRLGAVDFAPHAGEYEHGSWARGLRRALPNRTDAKIGAWIHENTLIGERSAEAWFYQMRCPNLATAAEVSAALGIGLDDLLRCDPC